VTELVTGLLINGLKALGASLGRVASGKTAETLARWNISEAARILERVRFVKPIWSPHREVDLQEFYHPCRLTLDGQLIGVVEIDELPDKHLVVTGPVGQGKSILMRFLVRQELVSGKSQRVKRLPLFVELRQLHASDEGLKGFLRRKLAELGLSNDALVFEFMAKGLAT
jgi:hypothetical protein